MAGLGEQSRQFDSSLANNASQFGANLGLQYNQLGQQNQQFGQNLGLQYDQLAQAMQQFGQNMGFNYAQLGQQNDQFGRSLGEQGRQFDANMGFGQQRADMADLMSLLGYDQQNTQINNQLLNSDFARAMQMLGLIPGMAPQGVDTNGVTSMANQNNQTNAANSAAQQQAQYAAYASILASLFGG